MASIAFGIGGAFLGSFVGQPALGYTIGSAIGAAAFPGSLPDVDVQGPRLGDRKVQLGSYGTFIPILKGTDRFAGAWTWSTDRREVPHTESVTQGGKGSGPEQTQTSTTYTYKVSCQILICKGPIIGVPQVWANGQLICDTTNVADAETIIASALFAKSVRIYTGTSTQEPDPLIESYKGVGNVSAHRGYAYMVIEDMETGPDGTAMPNIEFRPVESGTIANPTRLASFATPLPSTFTDEVEAGFASVSFQHGVMTAVSLEVATAQPRQRTTRMFDAAGTILSEVADYVETIDAAGDMKFYYCSNNHRLMYCVRTAAGGENVNAWYVDGIPVTRPVYPAIINDPAEPLRDDPSQQYLAVGRSFIYFNDYIYAIDGFASLYGYPTLVRFPAPDGVPESRPDAYYRAVLGPGYSDSSSVATDGTYIYLVRDIYIYRFDTELNLLQTWQVTRALVDSPCVVYQDRVAFYTNRFELWDISGATAVEVGTFAPGDTAYVLGHQSPVVFDKQGVISIVPRIESDTVPLSEIVTSICSYVGLSDGQLDVSELTDAVHGYTITRQATARANLDPLQQAFFFDAYEGDRKIKFRKRGGASVKTIPHTELAAHELGSPMPDYLSKTREMQLSLPRQVNVLYKSPSNNYQEMMQPSVPRITGSSDNDITVALPIVLSDAQAKFVADVKVFLAWIEKTPYKFTTWREHEDLEPTDVITIAAPTTSHTMRITRKDSSPVGIIAIEAVAEYPDVYEQTGQPGTPPTPAQVVQLAGPTVTHLLDIPVLRDQDDAPGFPAVAAGMLDGWHGSRLFKSVDDGASYTEATSFITAGAIGETTTALPNWTGGNVFDEFSTVDVQLIGSQTLSSTTEAGVFAGLNWFLIGNEIVAAKNAPLIATKKHRLSGFLRGRRGTDWAMQGHTTRERVVLLNSSALRWIPATSSEIGAARKFKGVSIGNSLAAASAQEFTYSGVNLKPLAPVHVMGYRDPSGNLSIEFVRQTRVGWEWRDFVDAPLGEDTESYEIDVLQTTGKAVDSITQANPGVVECTAHGFSTGDYIALTNTTGSQEAATRTFVITVTDANHFSIGVDTRKWTPYQSGGTARKRVRLITATTQSASYSSANQVTDFGGNQDPVHVYIYQISATVGRGFPRYASL